MAKAKKTKAAGGVVSTVDFTKATSSGGQSKRYPEGDYLFTVEKFKNPPADHEGKPYVEATLKFKEGKYKGQTIRDRVYLTDAALWRVRAFLEAQGVTVPNKKAAVKWDKYVGNDVGATLVDREVGEDKKRIISVVGDYIEADVVGDEDEDDDEDDEDDEDEDDEDDVEDLDVDDEL